MFYHRIDNDMILRHSDRHPVLFFPHFYHFHIFLCFSLDSTLFHSSDLNQTHWQLNLAFQYHQIVTVRNSMMYEMRKCLRKIIINQFIFLEYLLFYDYFKRSTHHITSPFQFFFIKSRDIFFCLFLFLVIKINLATHLKNIFSSITIC